MQTSDFDRNTRWLVRVEGFDHGPFEPEEIRERIRDGRLTLQSELCEERDGRWVLLEDVDPFRELCERLIEEARERADQMAMDKAEDSVRRTQKLRWGVSHFGLIGVLATAGVVAFILASKPTLQPSNYTSNIFYETELGRIDPWARFTGEREHEWRFGPDAPPAKASKKRKKRRTPRRGIGSDEVFEDKSDETLAVSFDFEDETEKRKITSDEINRVVVPKAQRLLQKCLMAEATRRSGVSGADFRFALLPTGRIASARVLGRMSGKMHACSKRSLRRVRVEPFGGGPQWVELSLRLSGQ